MIHHSDCGAIGFRDDKTHSVLLECAPDHEEEIRKMSFGQIKEHVSIYFNTEWGYLRGDFGLLGAVLMRWLL